jgi:pimeloyl-ACP methyl ester carboxylesterase
MLPAPDGTALAVRRTGSGAPVVFVHGSAGGLDSWDPVLPFLDGFQSWVYARRGYPPSGPARDMTFARDVADLRTVLDAVGERAHLVGGSHGATVVLHAARAGVDVRSLTLWEPALYSAGPRLRPVLDRYRALLAEGDLATASRLFLEQVARMPASMLDAVGETTMGADDAEGCLHDLEAMAADDPDLERFAGIAVPTLLLNGSDTWSPMPETMDALARVLPQAQHVVLDGQTHFATHMAPAEFAEPLRRFLLSR